MIRKLALAAAATIWLPACASVPALPVTVVQPAQGSSLQLHAVRASVGAGGIEISGRIHRPINQYGHVPGKILASVTLEDGLTHLQATAPWPRLPIRGPRVATFRLTVPVPADRQAVSATVKPAEAP